MTQQERTPIEQLGLFFMVWMGCFLFFNLLMAGMLLLFFGEEVYNVISSSESMAGEHLNLVRFLQIILSIGIFGAPPLVYMIISKQRDWSFFKLNKIPPLTLFSLTLLIMALSAPVIIWALEVNQNMSFPSALRGLESYLRDLEEKNEQMLKALLIMNSRFDFMVNFLMIAIVPALVEELLFRGSLQQMLHKALGDIHIAIFITGMFFSFIHFQFYGFFPRVLLGILFGYLFYWSGNLWVPIFAHFLNNAVQVVMLYLFQSGRTSYDVEKMPAFSPYITMIATVLLFTAVYIFDLATQKKASPEDGKGLG